MSLRGALILPGEGKFFSFFWKQGIHTNQSQFYITDPCHSADINDE